MLFRGIYTFIVLFVSFGTMLSQHAISDSVVAVDEVVVSALRYQNMALGATISKIDTLQLQSAQTQTVADVLMQQGGITITSYGLGGLSSASIRGNSSNHTAIVWNDINIQSPMNGGVNLAVIPVNIIDNVSVQYGGSGVAYGSGAMSGVIHLGTSNLFNVKNEAGINLASGSYGNKIISGSGTYLSPKIASTIKVFGQKVENNFKFKDIFSKDFPIRTQTNAGLTQFGILQENQLKMSTYSTFKTSVWLQHYDKDMQTRISAINLNNNTNQKDNNAILTGNWKYLKNNYSISVRTGLMYNQIQYFDVFKINNNNSSTSGIGELEYKQIVNKHLNVQLGFNNTYETAFSNSYTGKHKRNRSSLYGSTRLTFFNNRIRFMFGLRNEAVNFNRKPLVFSVGNEYEPTKFFIIKGNYSTNYKIPTLNDLYWRNGPDASGNPNLKPESGSSGDIGYKVNYQLNAITIDFLNNYYYSKIYNWINWIPDSKNIWTPINSEEGRSYGTELNAGICLGNKNKNLQIKGSYNYNISQITKENGIDILTFNL